MNAINLLDDSLPETLNFSSGNMESEFPEESIEQLLERANKAMAAATTLMQKPLTVPVRSVTMRATREMEAAFADTTEIPTASRDLNESDDDVIFVGMHTANVINLCSPDRGPVSSTLSLNNNHSRFRNDELSPRTPANSVQPPKPPQPSKQKGCDALANTVICAVCMDSAVGQQPHSTNCGHIFCGACIKEAIKIRRKCPLCNLTVKNIFPVFI